MKNRSLKRGFTLIELLIVIAIILILIAIALPNFLEAQIRARIAKAQSEMKTLATATVSYRLDWNNVDPVGSGPGPVGGVERISWWGFASYALTTPVAYLTSIPVDPFSEYLWEENHSFRDIVDPPYTIIRNTGIPASWRIGSVPNNNAEIQEKAGGPVEVSETFSRRACHSGFIYYSSGIDRVDSTVWGTPRFYSPTNGTQSFGDLYEFGPGDAYEDLRDSYVNDSTIDSVRQGLKNNGC
ncbi:MAG: prepilin-type N-terminal cleavage/methylation domain-containing protein [Candidatus Omnitrophica bacterium]|nr:prepilin-type N-terminal cleavage/methylation domain-containing protein [Candidatus Omnitrophota bacterium]MCB9783002.1 prepilin-type N-terminal cleavage/methylation domain-containing protein [Candidatus Omnitrophota bacterium]